MNKKIVLISFYNLESLGVRTIHSILKKEGFEVYSVFFGRLKKNFTLNVPRINKKDIDVLLDFIIKIDSFLVGISLNSIFFDLTSDITTKIKKQTDSTVIWGGIHPTSQPEQCLKFADAVCIGEGDGAITELANKLSLGNSISEIKNIYTKRGDQIVKNELRPLINNPDLIVTPDFSSDNKVLIENGKIKPVPSDDERISYECMTSRGCPFACSYCYTSKLKKIYSAGSGFIRRRSVDSVITELKNIKNRHNNLEIIYFLDDVFTLDYNWLKDFSEKYIEHINLPFYCYCHPKYSDDRTINLLKEMGVFRIIMGIQSGSEKIRRGLYKRFDTNKDIINAVKIMKKYNIHAVYDVIINNPVETDKDREDSFNLLLKLPRPINIDLRFLSHFPGTFLTDFLIKEGVVIDGDLEHNCKKSFIGWKKFYHIKNSKFDLFWNCLFSLLNFNFIPIFIILKIRKSRFLKKYPWIFLIFLRLVMFFDYWGGEIGLTFRKIIKT